jgi:hypothetical protein
MNMEDSHASEMLHSPKARGTDWCQKLTLTCHEPSCWILLASITTFVACLFFTGFSTGGADIWTYYMGKGVWLLLLGWLGALGGMFEWFANPLLLVAWLLIFFRWPKTSLLLGICAMGLATSFLLRARIKVLDHGPIVSHDAGYWLWIASILLAVVASIMSMIVSRRWGVQEKDGSPTAVITEAKRS